MRTDRCADAARSHRRSNRTSRRWCRRARVSHSRSPARSSRDGRSTRTTHRAAGARPSCHPAGRCRAGWFLPVPRAEGCRRCTAHPGRDEGGIHPRTGARPTNRSTTQDPRRGRVRRSSVRSAVASIPGVRPQQLSPRGQVRSCRTSPTGDRASTDGEAPPE